MVTEYSTLAEAIAEDRVSFAELEKTYGPDLALVKELIGVVPNCDNYLEIWPPGFRTYNLIVPNLLNLPQALLGVGGPADDVGLGMYASSRAASCAYCSAHTCSYALRRGASAEAVTGASRSESQNAVIAVAESLSTIPDSYHRDLGRNLIEHFGPGDGAWIVMGVAMMGFLNKFMDALGVELEQDSVDDVSALIGPTGWAVGQHGWEGASSDQAPARAETPPVDGWGTRMRVIRKAPGALRLERKWMAGIPSNPAEARLQVADRRGFNEPLITTVDHGRVRKMLATVLDQNLNPATTELGIGRKGLAGLIFARTAANDTLVEQNRTLARNNGFGDDLVEAVEEFATDSSRTASSLEGFDGNPATGAVLEMARAIAPSPAKVDGPIIAAAVEHLSSAAIVEAAVWVSVCQMLHRLSLFYSADH